VGRPVNLVAIETATPACAVGVRTGAGVEITRVVDEHRQHTEALTPGIATLLDECALTPRDVDRVVVDRGPGLFTGLRVGIATAVAFAQALGCEIVGVTSLELLAHGAFDAGVRGTLACAVDGRRGEVFVQSFSVVIEWATNGAPVTFTGDGVERYVADFNAVPNGEIYAQSVPSVHAALVIGEQRAPEAMIIPLYLREADAVANFTTRERRQ
jgi:tRNA threonylcarbamoyladenosine biosynthesis protein TsaB